MEEWKIEEEEEEEEMEKMEEKLRELVDVWTNDLNHNVIPFWQKYSVDRVHGGYFTHLDENGDRYGLFDE